MAKRHYIPVTVEEVPGVSEGQRSFIRRVVRTALEAEGVALPCEVDVLVTSDEGIRAINKEQRGIDRPTDVLSFPALELRPGVLPTEADADPGTGLIPLGDMALSYERVPAQAKEYGHSEKREVAFLVAHSMLHLLGYDHESEEDAKVMEQKQESALHKLGITRD